MNTLKIIKQMISQLENYEMNSIKGGINVCDHSCENGSRKGKRRYKKICFIDVSIVF